MSCSDRFYPCETEGFPPVKVYDYSTNIPIRGIEDRDFRFEEVAVKSIYMMQEATREGSFENNSFSYTEGIEYISSGALTDTSNFSGWTVGGGDAIYIPQSGVTVSSGDLDSVTGSFHAFPIDGDTAIGLFNTGGAVNPYIKSEDLDVTSSGSIYDGSTHQLYFNYKLNYGETGNLYFVLRGNSNTWYDTGSLSWVSTPTTGYITFTGNEISTYSHLFLADDFPVLTTALTVEIGSETSGSFITLDNVHIDALLKKNAFIDYVIPTGYMLQLTPDVGFHDVTSMFDGTSEYPNPHLKTLGPYKVDLGNLTDNLDNSVTITLDKADFRNSLSSNFKKYLWRALPITPNGQLGAGGLPARFEYVGDIVDNLFTVTEVQEPKNTTQKIIVGTKAKDMQVIVDDKSNFPGLTYPTPLSWRLEINLQVTKRTLQIKATDSSGLSTSVKRITLTNQLYEKYTRAVWNKFDEFGLVADIERLPGESNFSFSKRVRKSHSEAAGPSFEGVVNSATNELGLDKIPDAINIKVNKNNTNQKVITDYTYEVTAYSFKLFSDVFNIEEKLLVDPVYNTIDLTYPIINSPISIKTDSGADVDLNNIQIISKENSTTLVNRIKLNRHDVKYATVTYNYTLELLFKDYPTLESLINRLNKVKDYKGNNVFTVSLSSVLSGNESTQGLYLGSGAVTQSFDSALSWSPVFLKRISEVGYKDYVKGDAPTLKDSKFYSTVQTLKDQLNIFWGTAELDKTRWNSSESTNLGLDSVPTLFDPPITKILDAISGQSIYVNSVEAWGKNYVGSSNQTLINYGLVSNLFRPGVGFTEDLEPEMYITTTTGLLGSYLEDNISPLQNNNNVVFFSGQV